MDFMDAIKNETEKTCTENGAVGYSTSGQALVDFNYKLPSYRTDKQSLSDDFYKVIESNNPYIFKYLFYLRDCRGGLGERDAFRRCIVDALIYSDLISEDIEKIISLIPKFGRWDDLFAFFDTPLEFIALDIIEKQYQEDLLGTIGKKPISLLAKWLPSDNASSKQSRYYAHKIAKHLDIPVRDYRRAIVILRDYLDVLEVKACDNAWDEIDYNTVPSNANIRYKTAFLKHDEDRRSEYLDSLARGEAKINSSTNFPHDIVYLYTKSDWEFAYDEATEQLWNNLPDMPGLGNTLVIRDGSGSMTTEIPGSRIKTLDVADAITLYCADRCNSAFKNRFITFSSEPEFVDISSKKSLYDKIKYVRKFNDYSSTNLEATFDLILKAAVTNHMSQEDLPSQVMIISDMEFDMAVGSYNDYNNTTTLMETISKKFEDEGYKMPKLVFWNVNSRTNTIPMRENENGVALVSGFSLGTINMVLSGKLDPYSCIIDVLESDRYKEIPLAR